MVEVQPPAGTGEVALYARVSGSDQREDLERQLGRLAAFAASEGFAVTQTVSEVGSALNGARPRLRRLLANPRIGVIVCEHRDRLTRFGFGYLQAALAAQSRHIIVMNDAEIADDLVRDMTEVLTSFCARLYGKNSAARRAQAALRCAQRSEA